MKTSLCSHCNRRPGTVPTLVTGVLVCDLCARARQSPDFAPFCDECENRGTVECDECDGDGTVTCEYDHTHNCPKCDESPTRGHLVCPACKGESVNWSKAARLAPPFLFAEATAP